MQPPKLYGLILAGGESRRMGTDKAALHFHGESQAQFGHRLLSGMCAEVFLSVRAEQTEIPMYQSLPCIPDTCVNAGPLGGILSAMALYPDVAWLVIACDMPYLTAEMLEGLAAQRCPEKLATCFRNPAVGLFEPLCAIYEPAAFPVLRAMHGRGEYSLQRFLGRPGIETLDLPDSALLANFNTPEAYRRFLEGCDSPTGTVR